MWKKQLFNSRSIVYQQQKQKKSWQHASNDPECSVTGTETIDLVHWLVTGPLSRSLSETIVNIQPRDTETPQYNAMYSCILDSQHSREPSMGAGKSGKSWTKVINWFAPAWKSWEGISNFVNLLTQHVSFPIALARILISHLLVRAATRLSQPPRPSRELWVLQAWHIERQVC